MKPSLFIPKTITVGYQNRKDTYTGKLAYIIYTDEKGKLRKEASFNSWRDQSLPKDEFINEPTEGFVLNKKAGDYVSDWNHRQAYVRVYDPRGFEFEITIDNLLHILENTSSIKGKGLEGEFVYSWDGKNLVLLSADSNDYRMIKKHNELIHSGIKLKAKDMIKGATYINKSGEKLVYIGRFEYWESRWGNSQDLDETGIRYNNYIKKPNRYYFAKINSDGKNPCIDTMSGLSGIIGIDSEDVHERYSEFYEKSQLLRSIKYIDRSKDSFEKIEFTEFSNKIQEIVNKIEKWAERFYVLDENKKWFLYKVEKKEDCSLRFMIDPSGLGYYSSFEEAKNIKTIEDLYNKHKPLKQNIYYVDGTLHKTKVVNIYD